MDTVDVLKEGLIDVFKTGYELGHNDTVESCYRDAEERGRDLLDEMIEDLPNLTHAIKCCEENTKLIAERDELIDFAIWMTGCGYDFCQHEYFCKQRDKLLKGK